MTAASVAVMLPHGIQELRIALCPHCGAENDVAALRCRQCGEVSRVAVRRSIEASNDSVPDAMLDESLPGARAIPATVVHAPRAALALNAAVIAGAMIFSGAAVSAFFLYQQRSMVDASTPTITDGAARAVNAGSANAAPSMPEMAVPKPPPVAPTAAVLSPAEPVAGRPVPDLGRVPLPTAQARQAESAATVATSRPTRAAGSQASSTRPEPAAAAAAEARAKAALTGIIAAPPHLGPCTAAVAALGLCTLESKTGGGN